MEAAQNKRHAHGNETKTERRRVGTGKCNGAAEVPNAGEVSHVRVRGRVHVCVREHVLVNRALGRRVAATKRRLGVAARGRAPVAHPRW
jgi:hypothetical protein